MSKDDLKTWLNKIDNCNTPSELKRIKSQMPAHVAADINISRYVDNYMADMKRNSKR